MISRFDDYLVQQIASTTDHVDDSDPRWYERCRYTVVGPGLLIAHGVGVYPNSNLVDAFSVVVEDGAAQTTVQSSRSLAHERMDTNVGPIGITVRTGLRRTSAALDTNATGVGYELEFTTMGQPFDQVPLPIVRRHGQLRQRAAMFAQMGSVSGFVRFADQELMADSEWWFVKSNSWGVRAHAGDPHVEPDGTWRPEVPFIAVSVLDLDLHVDGVNGQLRRGEREEHVTVATEFRFEDARLLEVAVLATTLAGELLEFFLQPVATASIEGLFAHHADAFDGRYRGPNAYGETALVEHKRRSVLAPGERVGWRDSHACSARFGGATGVALVEIGCEV